MTDTYYIITINTRGGSKHLSIMNLKTTIKRILKEETNSQDSKKFPNNWKVINGKLTKTYKFDNYEQTLDFVSQVGRIAEKQNHHPEINFDYNTVKIKMYDHDKNKVSDKCHKFANAVEKLFN
jgi:4a-hydroxytetrahydrobiopterin dehydratase